MDNLVLSIWEIVISAVAAIATFSAVIVALWQTKYANKKKIKIKTTETIVMPYHAISKTNKEIYPKFLCISATNIGTRKITIVSHGVYFSNSYRITATDLDRASNTVLDIEENVSYRMQISELIKTFKAERKDIKHINRKLVVYVEDSAGKIYKKKCNRTIKDYLNLNDNELYCEV